LATLSSLFASLSEPESELESSLELSSLLETCFFFFFFLFFSFFAFDLDLLFFSENKIKFNAIHILLRTFHNSYCPKTHPAFRSSCKISLPLPLSHWKDSAL
jgi:hypothetical protein